MAKYGFTTAIPYGNDMVEVTGAEYCEWEDALEKVGDDTNGLNWATYDFLLDKGYLVSEPLLPRPSAIAQERAETKRTKESKGKIGAVEQRLSEVVESPGIRGIPDGLNYVSGESREPVWTQSRILAEQRKVLAEREKILVTKEKALEQKVSVQQILEVERAKGNAPHTPSEVFYIIAGVLVIAMVLLFAVGLYST
jgi:hypothetical protein